MSLALGDKINETMENINDKFGSILFSRFIAQKAYKRIEAVTEMQWDELDSLVLLVKS